MAMALKSDDKGIALYGVDLQCCGLGHYEYQWSGIPRHLLIMKRFP